MMTGTSSGELVADSPEYPSLGRGRPSGSQQNLITAAASTSTRPTTLPSKDANAVINVGAVLLKEHSCAASKLGPPVRGLGPRTGARSASVALAHQPEVPPQRHNARARLRRDDRPTGGLIVASGLAYEHGERKPSGAHASYQRPRPRVSAFSPGRSGDRDRGPGPSLSGGPLPLPGCRRFGAGRNRTGHRTPEHVTGPTAATVIPPLSTAGELRHYTPTRHLPLALPRGPSWRS